MQARFSKRLGAYLFDILLFVFMLIIASFFFPKNNVNALNKELDLLSQRFTQNEISLNSFLYQASSISQEIDKAEVYENVFNLLFILIYFIVIPSFTDGQTLGKRIFKLRVKKDNKKLSIKDMFIRSIISEGSLFMIISFVAIYFLPSFYYFLTTTILAIIEIILVMISLFMVLYRKDKFALQDVLSKTYVIEEL